MKIYYSDHLGFEIFALFLHYSLEFTITVIFFTKFDFIYIYHSNKKVERLADMEIFLVFKNGQSFFN